MSQVTFYFPIRREYAVRMDVNDPANITDEDIEAAYDKLPGGVCFQCSGYDQDWTLDLDTMDIELGYVEDQNGNVVLGES